MSHWAQRASWFLFQAEAARISAQCLWGGATVSVYLWRTFESHAPTLDRFILVQREEGSIVGLFILQTVNWRLRFLWRDGAEIQVRMLLPPCTSKTIGSENQWRKQAFLPSLSGVVGRGPHSEIRAAWVHAWEWGWPYPSPFCYHFLLPWLESQWTEQNRGASLKLGPPSLHWLGIFSWYTAT